MQGIEVAHTNKKIKLTVDSDKTLSFYGLKNEYVQVIVSILSNIHDLVIERKIENPEVDIKLYKENNDAILSITDNVGGIKNENLSKIFNPYFTTKHQSMGTGLGLYIAKMIIEDTMDGSLSVKNTDNGVTFTIRTPDAT